VNSGFPLEGGVVTSWGVFLVGLFFLNQDGFRPFYYFPLWTPRTFGHGFWAWGTISSPPNCPGGSFFRGRFLYVRSWGLPVDKAFFGDDEKKVGACFINLPQVRFELGLRGGGVLVNVRLFCSFGGSERKITLSFFPRGGSLFVGRFFS